MQVSKQAFPIDPISQAKLDLTAKKRSSLFAWRGQFSPELVELFLEEYSHQTTVVFDPFVGSGTTLFECARRGIECYGGEINPSAIEMANTIYFVNVPPADRRSYLQTAEQLLNDHFGNFAIDLFNYNKSSDVSSLQTVFSLEATAALLRESTLEQPYVTNLLINAIIRCSQSSCQPTMGDFARALREHFLIVENLPFTQKKYEVFHADARVVPLSANSIDLIITSPPYINVFNYHQNNRAAMELLGWNLLDIARSEIGSNRKHRQNRFLTVIQYALDITTTLSELHRLLRPHATAILVVGRESSVRGISFKNSQLVETLATSVCGFTLKNGQERKFKNKFGEQIYEDILYLEPNLQKVVATEQSARAVAKGFLQEAADTAQAVVRSEILDALIRIENVKPSPLFALGH